MSETLTTPVDSISPEWEQEFARRYTGNVPYVPQSERMFAGPDATSESLRTELDQVVRDAYINNGMRPDQYGVSVNKVGACKIMASKVVESAWRKGIDAVYVENPESTHGYVILPTSQEEASQIRAGHMPEDPIVVDPTYAQFMDTATGQAFSEDNDPFGDGVGPAKVRLGIEMGYHTPESPFFVGRASTLRNPASRAVHNQNGLTPWDNPQVVQF